MNEITEKQRRFCEEYVVDLNGTQAAIRAGYSVNSANEQASRMLAKDNIQAEVARLKTEQSERTEITADRVLQAMAEVAFGDIRGMFNDDGSLKRPHEWDDETAAAVAGMDVVTVSAGEGMVEHVAKIKRTDRLRAMEMLARHLSLFNDKLDVNVTSDLAERMRRAKERKNEVSEKASRD